MWLFTIRHCSFDAAKSKHDYCRVKDCIKKICKDLKEHATKIISYEEMEMILLTNEENKSYLEQNVCYICVNKFSTDDDDKKYH